MQVEGAMTRSDAYFRRLFEQSGFNVIDSLQHNDDPDMYRTMTYALIPKKRWSSL